MKYEEKIIITMKLVRIKDIAAEAGVSIGTVDRVLHNRGEVAPKTREKVMAIAKKLNYQPNIVAQALTAKKQYHIAALIPRDDIDNTYWTFHPKGMEKAIQELKPFLVDIKFYFFELHNENDFFNQSNKLLADNPDGVIFAPILKKESKEFTGKLDAKNIPYIFIDTFIENSNCLSFVGEDAYQSGRVSASIIDYGLDINKDILIVNLAKDIENTQHLNKRNQGFMSYFLDKGRNKGIKITVEITSTEREIVKEKMDQILKNNPNIGAILVSSAKTHIIAQYLQNENFNNIILVGYELTDENIGYLRKGIIQFLVGQKPSEQSEKAVKRLFDYLTTKQNPLKKEYQHIEIINMENVDSY